MNTDLDEVKWFDLPCGKRLVCRTWFSDVRGEFSTRSVVALTDLDEVCSYGHSTSSGESRDNAVRALMAELRRRSDELAAIAAEFEDARFM